MQTNINSSIIMRLKLANQVDVLPNVLSTIGQLHGHVGAIDIVKTEKGTIIRDITIETTGDEHVEQLINALNKLNGVKVHNISDRTFLMHLGGKIQTSSKFPLTNREELSMAYTPGVARVCMAIHEQPEKAFNLTIKSNTVAVISDGTAVLGLGDIGPLAALPVMEGKAMLLKEFANVDAFPICLSTTDINEIIAAVKAIAPSFGAINLEDISAPRCFAIEKKLQEALDIPVFHDDQHGTAAVMTAALINALKIVNKKMQDIKVVFNGVGAAGNACKDMLLNLGVTHIVGCDRKGVLHKGRTDLTPEKQQYVATTNPHNETGCVYDVIAGADVFVGLSAPNTLRVEDIKKMNKDPIVFAMANPVPEIMPEIAYPHVAIMATGRSDYPNQINNLLAFPGIFRGALDCHASEINQAMKMAAVYAIANAVDENDLSPDYIVPSVFNNEVVKAVAEAVKEAAYKTGVARK